MAKDKKGKNQEVAVRTGSELVSEKESLRRSESTIIKRLEKHEDNPRKGTL